MEHYAAMKMVVLGISRGMGTIEREKHRSLYGLGAHLAGVCMSLSV